MEDILNRIENLAIAGGAQDTADDMRSYFLEIREIIEQYKEQYYDN